MKALGSPCHPNCLTDQYLLYKFAEIKKMDVDVLQELLPCFTPFAIMATDILILRHKLGRLFIM